MIGELAALGAAVCWSVSAVLYKEALSRVKPIPANTIRCLCTSIFLIGFLVIIGKFGVLTDLSTDAIILVSISGMIGLGLGDTFYMASLHLIGVARSVPITCTYPLFNLLLAVFLQGERITSQVVFATIMIVIGVWLISKEQSSHQQQGKISVKGVAYALTTAIVWAVSISMINMAVTLQERASLDQALALNTARVVAATVFLSALAPMLKRRSSFPRIEKRTLLALISGGIVALSLGWFFLTVSFIHTSESRAVPISSTTPVFATAAGMILLHEKVTVRNVVGSIVIIGGIFLIFVV